MESGDVSSEPSITTSTCRNAIAESHSIRISHPNSHQRVNGIEVLCWGKKPVFRRFGPDTDDSVVVKSKAPLRLPVVDPSSTNFLNPLPKVPPPSRSSNSLSACVERTRYSCGM